MYSPKQVAEILNVNTETVHRWCRRGLIKYTRIGRTIRIDESEVERLRGTNSYTEPAAPFDTNN